eukprot:12881954-Prorocentrum_lima.AAC.1
MPLTEDISKQIRKCITSKCYSTGICKQNVAMKYQDIKHEQQREPAPSLEMPVNVLKEVDELVE